MRDRSERKAEAIGPPRGRRGLILLALLGFALIPFDSAQSQESERLEEVRAGVKALQPKIDEAIDKGVDLLVSLQKPDGTWPGHERPYPSGQTALAVYTLLKSGLTPNDPVVARGLMALMARPPGETYAAGCQLMALEATGDPAFRDRMQSITDDVLAWQDRGLWSYPNTHGNPWSDGKGPVDLSCTQYAALGLRAARLAGIDVPTRAWSALYDKTMDAPVGLNSTQRRTLSYEGTRDLLGFPYRPGGRAATGSMTAAGIALITLALDGLDVADDHAKHRRGQRVIRDALHWLDVRWDVKTNPGAGAGWLYYYLYGVERVGSFLGLELIGDRAWYLEGAQHLVDAQKKDGSWANKNNPHDTCFALLFLKRASAGGATTGIPSTPRAFACDGPESAVHLRGTGRPETTLWVTGFSDAARTSLEGEFIVQRVEYLAGGTVIDTVDGDGTPWSPAQRFAIQHRFTTPGSHSVTARVTLAPKSKDSEPVIWESEGFDVVIESLLGQWWTDVARSLARNLVPRARPSAKVTSREGPDHDGLQATDGDFATAWHAAVTDESPTLELKLRRPLVADTVVLVPAVFDESLRTIYDAATHIEVTVNGARVPHVLTPKADALRPYTVKLDKPLKVRNIEVRVTEFEGGVRKGRFGFSEIALRLDAPPR